LQPRSSCRHPPVSPYGRTSANFPLLLARQAHCEVSSPLRNMCLTNGRLLVLHIVTATKVLAAPTSMALSPVMTVDYTLPPLPRQRTSSLDHGSLGSRPHIQNALRGVITDIQVFPDQPLVMFLISCQVASISKRWRGVPPQSWTVAPLFSSFLVDRDLPLFLSFRFESFNPKSNYGTSSGQDA